MLQKCWCFVDVEVLCWRCIDIWHQWEINVLIISWQIVDVVVLLLMMYWLLCWQKAYVLLMLMQHWHLVDETLMKNWFMWKSIYFSFIFCRCPLKSRSTGKWPHYTGVSYPVQSISAHVHSAHPRKSKELLETFITAPWLRKFRVTKHNPDYPERKRERRERDRRSVFVSSVGATHRSRN